MSSENRNAIDMEQKQKEISQDQGRGVIPYTAETDTACIKKTEGACS